MKKAFVASNVAGKNVKTAGSQGFSEKGGRGRDDVGKGDWGKRGKLPKGVSGPRGAPTGGKRVTGERMGNGRGRGLAWLGEGAQLPRPKRFSHLRDNSVGLIL